MLRGAYGFVVEGLEGAESLLVPVEPGWPILAVRWVEDPDQANATSGAEAESTVRFTPEGAFIDVGSSGVVEIQRDPAVATFRLPAIPDRQALVHPYLGWAASIVARWLGREVFHAGAFVHDSKAWGVLGTRTAGKSSMLGWLHREGFPIVADDLLVLADSSALAGPRSLDLRDDAAERLGVGKPVGRVGARERWRVELAAVPWSVPVSGFVFLGWGDRVEVVGVTGRERLTRLSVQLTIPEIPADPQGLLDLAALPALELRRPRDWRRLDEAGAALLRAIGA